MKQLIFNYFKTRLFFYSYSSLAIMCLVAGNFVAFMGFSGMVVTDAYLFLRDKVIKEQEDYIKELQKHIADLNKSKFTLNQ